MGQNNLRCVIFCHHLFPYVFADVVDICFLSSMIWLMPVIFLLRLIFEGISCLLEGMCWGRIRMVAEDLVLCICLSKMSAKEGEFLKRTLWGKILTSSHLFLPSQLGGVWEQGNESWCLFWSFSDPYRWQRWARGLTLLECKVFVFQCIYFFTYNKWICTMDIQNNAQIVDFVFL